MTFTARVRFAEMLHRPHAQMGYFSAVERFLRQLERGSRLPSLPLGSKILQLAFG